ncbi:hypothetical protein [Acrocarpospora corrugata]|uniref:hypothetical protein n=1 Tax=Acrocarpospora corrugata TaxID=35763 RepID=UPI001479211F
MIDVFTGVKRHLGAGLALTAVVLCSLAVLTSASVSETPTVRSACPPQYGGGGAGGWVPAASGIDGAGDTLVPGEPVAATICAYPGSNMKMGRERFAGSRLLADGVQRMARDLSYLPIARDDGWSCTMMGGPMINYLIRFDYPGGKSLWLGSAEEVNSCATTTNGTIKSRSYVGKTITAAYPPEIGG